MAAYLSSNTWGTKLDFQFGKNSTINYNRIIFLLLYVYCLIITSIAQLWHAANYLEKPRRNTKWNTDSHIAQPCHDMPWSLLFAASHSWEQKQNATYISASHLLARTNMHRDNNWVTLTNNTEMERGGEKDRDHQRDRETLRQKLGRRRGREWEDRDRESKSKHAST